MNFTVTLGGVDRTAYLISFERQERLCQPGASATLVMSPSLPLPNLWDTFVLKEYDNTLTMTGYVMAIRKSRPESTVTLECSDTWVRAERAWNTTQDRKSAGETLKTWITTLLGEAGLTVTYTESNDPVVPVDYPIAVDAISNLVIDLVKMGEWYVKVKTDGTIQVGKFAGGNYVSAAMLNNGMAAEYREDDSTYRNVAKVFGVADVFGKTSLPKLIDGPDRTAVWGSGHIGSSAMAKSLSARLLDTFYANHRVAAIETTGSPAVSCGDLARVDVWTIDYASQVTGVQSQLNTAGYQQRIEIGDICPRFFGYAPRTEFPYTTPTPDTWRQTVVAATWGSGIYKTYSYASPPTPVSSTPTWYAQSVGLDSLYVSQYLTDPQDTYIQYCLTCANMLIARDEPTTGNTVYEYRPTKLWRRMNDGAWSLLTSANDLVQTLYPPEGCAGSWYDPWYDPTIEMIMVNPLKPRWLGVYASGASLTRYVRQWHGKLHNRRQIFFMESDDYGSTWSSAVMVRKTYANSVFGSSTQLGWPAGVFRGSSAFGDAKVLYCLSGPAETHCLAATSDSLLWDNDLCLFYGDPFAVDDDPAWLVSTDGGTTWGSLASNISQQGLSIQIDPGDQDTVFRYGTNTYGADTYGLWRSTDRGSTWTQFQSGLTFANSYRHALNVLYNPSGRATTWRYFGGGSYRKRLYKTTNAGVDWTYNEDVSLPTNIGFGVIVVPDSDGLLYGCASYPASMTVMASNNEGATWYNKNGVGDTALPNTVAVRDLYVIYK